MSHYINLNRIEFTVTLACSGKCKHCSRTDLSNNAPSIDADKSAAVVKRLAERFPIESVMTFDGEPLLVADTVCKIHAASRDCGIPKRQLITNGFFSKDKQKIDEVAKALCDSGVNDVLLSIDTFHQEFIPLEPVLYFAKSLLKHKIPSLHVHPAWVVNETANNPYNTETKRLLKIFTDKDIPVSRGNNISPSGNAAKYLKEYFSPPGEVDLSVPCGSAKYRSRLDDIKAIGIHPDGSVIACTEIGNIYRDDILHIVDNYDPYRDPILRKILDDGVAGLLEHAKAMGIDVDISDCYSACGVCHKIRNKINEAEQ